MFSATRATCRRDEVKALWGRDQGRGEARARRSARAAGLRRASDSGALAGVPLALPALTRALKLQEKAGKVGFDWNDPRAVIAKIREEIDEVEAELDAGDAERVAGEVGDLLFAVANLARHLRRRPRDRAARRQRQIRAPLRPYRGAAQRSAAASPPRRARRDGRAWDEAKRREQAKP